MDNETTQKIMTYGQQITEQLVAGARQDGVEPGELLYATIVACMNMTLTFTAGDRATALAMMERAVQEVESLVGGMDVVKGPSLVAENG